MRAACGRVSECRSGQYGRGFDLDDGVRVEECLHFHQRHGGIVPSHEAAMDLAEWLEAREVGLTVDDVNRHATDVVGSTARRPHDLQHTLERAGPLLDEPPALGGGLPGHEQQPPPGRREHAMVPATRPAEHVGVDDPERHERAPPSAMTTVSPLVAPASSHSASTARATSSGEINRTWPVVARAACRAASGDMPAFAAMRATDSRVISVSTYPGHTAFTVTPVPATSAATERGNPTTACFDAL